VQAAELENGTQKLILMEKLRSLSEILFRSDVDGLSQEGREDSDYGDEMELDETTVSGHGNRENDQGVFRGTLSF
jgi:WD and tetratricopeptide repeats protein 1